MSPALTILSWYLPPVRVSAAASAFCTAWWIWSLCSTAVSSAFLVRFFSLSASPMWSPWWVEVICQLDSSGHAWPPSMARKRGVIDSRWLVGKVAVRRQRADVGNRIRDLILTTKGDYLQGQDHQ